MPGAVEVDWRGRFGSVVDWPTLPEVADGDGVAELPAVGDAGEV